MEKYHLTFRSQAGGQLSVKTMAIEAETLQEACDEAGITPWDLLNIDVRNPIPFGWSATIELNNGLIQEIWYTSYHSTKDQIKNIISIHPTK